MAHPLRNNFFIVKERVKGEYSSIYHIEFKEDGTVLKYPHRNITGEWILSPNGRVSWYLMNPMKDIHSYSAELHLNHFGSSARIIKGVVLNNRRSLNIFRRVVASFDAEGIDINTIR